ncbi:MAG: ABC transporter permease subunit [Anaerolineales bacterium]
MLSLLLHELRSRWLATLAWGAGLSLFGATYISLYPEVEAQLAELADLSVYQAMGFDMATFEGFIGSTVVLFVPVLLAIYVITTSTRTIAGEEEDGSLELLLASPLHRWQIVAAKALAIALSTFIVLLIVSVADGFFLRALSSTVEVDVTSTQLFVAVLNGWPLMIAIAMIALFLAAYLPTQRSAVMIVTVVFVASYFGENLTGMVDSLEAIKPYSLFTYFDTSVSVFQEGVQASDVAVLLGVAAVFFTLALLAFGRRNVTAAAWPWQRALRE